MSPLTNTQRNTIQEISDELKKELGKCRIFYSSFTHIDTCIRQGATWHRISCTPVIKQWILDNFDKDMYTVKSSYISIHEKVYTMMVLKWS